MNNVQYREITKIIGKVPVAVYQTKIEHDDGLKFEFDDGTCCIFYHDNICCESVWIEEIIGDLEDLIGNPLLVAEERYKDNDGLADCENFQGWTFYTFRNIKGTVDVRFYGASNGNYGVKVSCAFKKYTLKQGRDYAVIATKVPKHIEYITPNKEYWLEPRFDWSHDGRIKTDAGTVALVDFSDDAFLSDCEWQLIDKGKAAKLYVTAGTLPEGCDNFTAGKRYELHDYSLVDGQAIIVDDFDQELKVNVDEADITRDRSEE